MFFINRSLARHLRYMCVFGFTVYDCEHHVEYEGVYRHLMCHKEHSVGVAVCVGGDRGH